MGKDLDLHMSGARAVPASFGLETVRRSTCNVLAAGPEAGQLLPMIISKLTCEGAICAWSFRTAWHGGSTSGYHSWSEQTSSPTRINGNGRFKHCGSYYKVAAALGRTIDLLHFFFHCLKSVPEEIYRRAASDFFNVCNTNKGLSHHIDKDFREK